MPELLNFNEFCKDLKEVTSTKIMDKKKFHSEGLFSEQIFGPLKNYTCQCGKYYGISFSGGKCKECGVDIVSNYERRRRFAKIILPIPVINPLFYDLLVDIGGLQIKNPIDLLLHNEHSILYKDGEDFLVVTKPDNIPENCERWEKLDAIYNLVFTFADTLTSIGYDEWNIIKNNIDKLFLQQIIVLPPDLRPAAKSVSKNNQVVDKINRFYMQILMKREIMKDTIIDINRDKQLFYQYFKQLQNDVNELYKHILDKLSKKEGLIRGNILGKRIDFSGRAVIVPEPTLDIDECVLPYIMILELFKIQVSKKLIELRKFKTLSDAIEFVEDCIEYKIPSLFRICEQIVTDEVCILNRQPSLHRLGMIGFKIKVSLENVIKIHPLSCRGFNADFDGDQMAVYIPITEESKQEIKDKFLMSKNLNSPSNNSLVPLPNQDIIFGIHILTSNKLDSLQDKAFYKGKEITESRKIFNECLPEDYDLIDYPVDKRILSFILNDIKTKYNSIETSQVLDKIKKEGFKYTTLFGTTLSLNQCVIPNYKEVQNNIYNCKDVGEQLQNVLSDDTLNFLKDNFHYSDMIKSGARGNWDQIRQITLTRGFVSNFDGEILSTPIKNCLIDGLDEKEFFMSTFGCRKGLLDVALNTGTSGYLSRKLIFSCANLQISLTFDDCGTKDYLQVFVNNEKKAKMLMYRYHLEDSILKIIDENNYREIIGKTIYLRSPIFCKSENICHKCYGDLYKFIDSKFIGVIAAQSLGEHNTQLVLRTFHTSGSAITNKSDKKNVMKQMDIIGDLSIVSKLLHKFKGKNYKDIVDELFEVYNIEGNIHHVHFECVVAQLMWKEFRKWRLLENRETIEPDYYSIQSVPSFESWLLGLAFSNPKKHIINGIFNSGFYKGIMDKILRGERI